MDLRELKNQILTKKAELAILQGSLKEAKIQDKPVTGKKKRGRPLLGVAPMSSTERSRKLRASRRIS